MTINYRIVLLILSVGLHVNGANAFCIPYIDVGSSCKKQDIKNTNNTSIGNVNATTVAGDTNVGATTIGETSQTVNADVIKQFIQANDANSLFLPLTTANTTAINSQKETVKELKEYTSGIIDKNRQAEEESQKWWRKYAETWSTSPPSIPIKNASSTFGIDIKTSETTPVIFKQTDVQNQLLINALNTLNTTLSNLNLTNTSMNNASQVIAQTTSFTAEWGKTYSIAAAAAVTVTLPTSVGNNGKDITLVRTDSTANVVTIDPNAAETVNGQATLALNNSYSSNVIRSDGTNAIYVQGASNVAAEFGENTSITNGSTFSTSLADITGSSFTIPTAGTWSISYAVFGRLSVLAAANVVIADSLNNIVPNSTGQLVSYSGGFNDGYGINNTVQLVTTGATTYKLRGVASGGTFIVQNLGQTGTTATAGAGNSKISWGKISGFIPVSGQSVDYVSANNSVAQTLANVADEVLSINTTLSGNIPLSGNTFTLSAGKTYELTAIIPYTSGANIEPRWFNVTASSYIGNGSKSSGAAEGETTVSTAIITPSVTTQVRIQNTFASGGTVGFVSGNRIMTTSAIIKQLGSSAAITTTVNTLAHVLVSGMIGSASGASGTTVTYGSEQYDTTNSMNIATGIFTAPRAGYYQVQFQAFWSSVTATIGGRIGLIMSKNGSGFGVDNPIASLYVAVLNPTNVALSGGRTVFLNAGETFSLRAFFDAATAGTLANNSNFEFMTINELPISN